MEDDAEEPFDENGRDPELVDEYERFVFPWAGLPFNLARVPRGVTAAEWRAKQMRFAETLPRRIGTEAECWALAKYALGFDERAITEYVTKLAEQRGAGDASFQELCRALGISAPPTEKGE